MLTFIFILQETEVKKQAVQFMLNFPVMQENFHLGWEKSKLVNLRRIMSKSKPITVTPQRGNKGSFCGLDARLSVLIFCAPACMQKQMAARRCPPSTRGIKSRVVLLHRLQVLE